MKISALHSEPFVHNCDCISLMSGVAGVLDRHFASTNMFMHAISVTVVSAKMCSGPVHCDVASAHVVSAYLFCEIEF